MQDSSSCRRRVVVIGGGFSGAVVAIHLLTGARSGDEIVVVEPNLLLGRGLAYGTPCDSHRLNVPAGRLGLDPDHEAGFIAWLQSQGQNVSASDFVPRHWLGSYVESRLQAAIKAATLRGVHWHHEADLAVCLTRHRPPYLVRTARGTLIAADQVVLATGHLPPNAPAVGSLGWGTRGLVPDPWGPVTTQDDDLNGDLLLVGSGLTAIDVVSQRLDAGHIGTIHLLSRRGLLPQPHRVLEALPTVGLSPIAELGDELGLRSILHAVRRWVREARATGGDWRDVMASLRPLTPRLWQRLSVRDRRQFLRHLQPFWDTHRHRVAPGIHARFQARIAAGQVKLHAGRIVGIERSSSGLLSVKWRPRGSSEIEVRELQVSKVINCTGPSAALSRARAPLLASLRASGVLTSDGLGQGLQVDEEMRPVDACGIPAEGLYYVGPMLKAQRWEAIAIPELRVHARDVARRVLAELAVDPQLQQGNAKSREMAM